MSYAAQLRDARRERLGRIAAAALAQQEPEPIARHEAPDRPKCKYWFRIIEDADAGIVRIDTIKKAVAAHFGMLPYDLTAPTRQAKAIRARHIAIYMASLLSHRGREELGRRFARDHSTIKNAVERIERLLKTDRSVADDIALIDQRIREMGNA